jgi:hypothetical protein
MNWITAFRMFGGDLDTEDIQRVRDRLDDLGYETDIDAYWISHLRRGSTLVWSFERDGGDRRSAMRLIDAMHVSDVLNLNATFGAYSISHLHDDHYHIPSSAITPSLGAATILPLPKGISK